MNQNEELVVGEYSPELSQHESKFDQSIQRGGVPFSDSFEDTGVLRTQGSGAYLSSLLRAKTHLENSLWFPVFGKLAVGALVLFSTAYLGQRARTAETYGELNLAGVGSGVVENSKPMRDPMLESVPSQGLEPPRKSALLAATASPSPPCQNAAKDSVSGVTKDGLIILNEASATELTQLPSVGPARAEAIIKLRERLGRFKKISDLLRVKGIGWKSLKKIQEKVILDRPVVPEVVQPTSAPVPSGGKGGKTEKRELEGA